MDIADISAVLARQVTDRSAMIELAKLVYPTAETEFARLLNKLDRGDPIEI